MNYKNLEFAFQTMLCTANYQKTLGLFFTFMTI